jgi:REP element-mobilizing transposase RayT
MPRTARLVVPDVPYHVVQRGNYRQDIFEDDEDKTFCFLFNLLQEFTKVEDHEHGAVSSIFKTA